MSHPRVNGNIQQQEIWGIRFKICQFEVTFLKLLFTMQFGINYLKCWERKDPRGIAEQERVT